MFAVIKTGGKQYKVAENDVIAVETLGVEPGATVEFEPLMVGTADGVKIGVPVVAGAKVTAEVVDLVRTRRVLIFKKTRRKGYRRLNGHRQSLAKIRVTSISA